MDKELPFTQGQTKRPLRCKMSRLPKAVVYTEFNIEGNPQHNFIDLVSRVQANTCARCHWCHNVISTQFTIAYLTEMIQEFQRNGTELLYSWIQLRHDRRSEKPVQIESELYTAFAHSTAVWAIISNRSLYCQMQLLSKWLGTQINAGHDLSLDNIQFLNKIFRDY
jgi:pyridoxine 5-phosphate synthase